MSDDEFEVVFEQHKRSVYEFIWRMSGSEAVAEDITQEVFLILLRGKAKLDPNRGSPRALLLGIARRLEWKRWRNDQRWSPLDEETLVALPLRVDAWDASQAVPKAVSLLPPLQREVLILTTYENLSLNEISNLLNVELGTVKSRLHRARENLKCLLAPYKTDTVNKGDGYGLAK